MRVAIFLTLFSASAGPLLGQQAVATADVNVRSGQSMSSRILDHLQAGDTVTLVRQTKRLGYYHIQESSGLKGWVYARYLRVSALTVEPLLPPSPPPTANYDPADPTSGATVRATLWEVHPITKIEVFNPSPRKWRSLP
jgi:uncharacterized protein YgiM (DUF1202 family)